MPDCTSGFGKVWPLSLKLPCPTLCLKWIIVRLADAQSRHAVEAQEREAHAPDERQAAIQFLLEKLGGFQLSFKLSRMLYRSF